MAAAAIMVAVAAIMAAVAAIYGGSYHGGGHYGGSYHGGHYGGVLPWRLSRLAAAASISASACPASTAYGDPDYYADPYYYDEPPPPPPDCDWVQIRVWRYGRWVWRDVQAVLLIVEAVMPRESGASSTRRLFRMSSRRGY